MWVLFLIGNDLDIRFRSKHLEDCCSFIAMHASEECQIRLDFCEQLQPIYSDPYSNYDDCLEVNENEDSL